MSAPEIFLSVIVPTWNSGHLLERSLGSVLMQMADDCELIVVDDGSSDDTPARLETIAAAHPQGFRWLRQENAGAAAARNAGLRASHGSHVLFLDADDELLPGALAAVCTVFRSDPCVTVVIGARLSCWPDGREKRHAPPRRIDTDPCRRVAAYLLDKTLAVSHGAIAARRNLAEDRPYPEALRGREDIPVWANWLARGCIRTIDTPLVRIHKSSASLRHTVKSNEALEHLLAEEIFRCLPEDCQRLRKPYRARRCLSLCRAALRAGEYDAARRHLMDAICTAPRQLFVSGQLLKLAKAWVSAWRN